MTVSDDEQPVRQPFEGADDEVDALVADEPPT